MKHTLFGTFNLDAVGFSASLLCAIHCAAMPLLLSILPLASAEFLLHEGVEFFMIGVGVVVGAWSLSHGYLHHHKNFSAGALMLFGFAVIAFGHGFAEEQESIVTPLGASLVALSHIVNWRLMQRTKDCCTQKALS